MSAVNIVDVCCGLTWGDEGKGKIVSQLAKSGFYDYICRWAGGDNAGHTVYLNGKKYETHLIPTGVFFRIKSIIGPGCVVNKKSFKKELSYLEKEGFDTSFIKISPKCHIVTEDHLKEDLNNNKSTSRGIGPCYRDKFSRTGKRVSEDDFFRDYIWDEKLNGNILCEGAQGFWLDIDHGNYPYVTSSTTLPYGCCSLGFSPQKIRDIYGAAKFYDTRVGFDPQFPETLLEDEDKRKVIEFGKEFGVTTGKMRKVDWLNFDKLIESINISGTTIVIISKKDILENTGFYKLYYNNNLVTFKDMTQMTYFITQKINILCPEIKNIVFSDHPEIVEGI